MNFADHLRGEHAYLRALADKVAQENPPLAGQLGRHAGDPDVECLIQGAALLNAGLRHRLEDGFPEVTQGHLSRIWPFPLRPIPACGVVNISAKAGTLDEPMALPAGESLALLSDGRPMVCQTCHALTLHPLALLDRQLTVTNAHSEIRLTFHYQGTGEYWQTQPLSLFLGNDPQVAATLALWCEQYQDRPVLQVEDRQFQLDSVLSAPTPNAENRILPHEGETSWALQSLAEYLYLPHVKDFLTLDFGPAYPYVALGDSRTFTVVLSFNGEIPLTQAELAATFQLHCVPVISLTQQKSSPLRLVQGQSVYPLPYPADHWVYAITNISMAEEPDTLKRGRQVHFQPDSELTPESRYAPDPTLSVFYAVRIGSDVLGRMQHELVFYNNQGEPLTEPPCQAVVCDLLITSAHTPALTPGSPFLLGMAVIDTLDVTTVTPFSPPYPAVVNSHHHWRLMASLSFSPFFLNHRETVQQVLNDFCLHALHNLPQVRRIRQAVAGIMAVKTEPVNALMGERLRRGLQMTLTLDEAAFSNPGETYTFAAALSVFFTHCLTTNSFLMLDVITQPSQTRWALPLVRGQRAMM
ncbi:type VI secretion system baseplate subunit TssF [Serratia aquatilis]|uniref:Type VI secretion system baseplate subunit TssF n=1 Tax=Serratia aquatilis TaxID=1737515 RepID=A0ABV6EHU0_9GAMM